MARANMEGHGRGREVQGLGWGQHQLPSMRQLAFVCRTIGTAAALLLNRKRKGGGRSIPIEVQEFEFTWP